LKLPFLELAAAVNLSILEEYQRGRFLSLLAEAEKIKKNNQIGGISGESGSGQFNLLISSE
jgi:hypothetical protein